MVTNIPDFHVQKEFLKKLSHFWVTYSSVGPLREALILSDTSISSSLSLYYDMEGSLQWFGQMTPWCFFDFWGNTHFIWSVILEPNSFWNRKWLFTVIISFTKAIFGSKMNSVPKSLTRWNGYYMFILLVENNFRIWKSPPSMNIPVWAQAKLISDKL